MSWRVSVGTAVWPILVAERNALVCCSNSLLAWISGLGDSGQDYFGVRLLLCLQMTSLLRDK